MGEWFQSYERGVKDESPVFVINVFLVGAFDLKPSNSLQFFLARGFLSRLPLPKYVFIKFWSRMLRHKEFLCIWIITLLAIYLYILWNNFTNNWMKLGGFILNLLTCLRLALSEKVCWQNSKSWDMFLKCLNTSTTLSRFTKLYYLIFNQCSTFISLENRKPEVSFFQGI